jgi:hypothetical protein
MQEMTNLVAATSAQLGLIIHKGKTKILKVNSTSTQPVKLEDETLEVEAFTYLASVIDKDGGTDANVRTRIGKSIWKSRS